MKISTLVKVNLEIQKQAVNFFCMNITKCSLKQR